MLKMGSISKNPLNYFLEECHTYNYLLISFLWWKVWNIKLNEKLTSHVSLKCAVLNVSQPPLAKPGGAIAGFPVHRAGTKRWCYQGGCLGSMIRAQSSFVPSNSHKPFFFFVKTKRSHVTLVATLKIFSQWIIHSQTCRLKLTFLVLHQNKINLKILFSSSFLL